MLKAGWETSFARASGRFDPKSVDAEIAACALLCFLQGLRVVRKVGRSGSEMSSAADQAMRLLT